MTNSIHLNSKQIKGFVASLLQSNYDDPAPIPDCHMEWWEMCCSPERLVSLAAPRSHAKSTAITHAFILASVLFRINDYVWIVSDTEKQAKEFLGDINKELTYNEDLIDLFEIDHFDKDTETCIIVSFKDGKQFRVDAKGASQSLRGFKWNHKRPNLIVIDDLENDENTQSKNQRDKLKRWVDGALIPCLSRSGKVRAVGTIIHADSWLAETMPQDDNPFTINTPLKKYSTRLSNGWYSALYRGHPAIGDYSKILWPSYRTAEFFEKEYTRLAARGREDIYAAEQLNNPIDETHAYFKVSDLKPLPSELPEFLNFYVGCDFAISHAQKADYTVFVVVGVDEFGHLNVVDVIRGRFDPEESTEVIFKLEREYNPDFFVVEKGVLAHAIGSALNREMSRRRRFPQLEPLSTSGDKPTKARGIQKAMRAGFVYFDTEATWFPIFKDEFLRFPKGVHDDQVDALAMIGLKLDALLDAPTEEEIEEERYQEELRQDYQDTGKDLITGY